MKNIGIVILMLIPLCILAACGVDNDLAAGPRTDTTADAEVSYEPPEKVEVSDDELINYAPEMKRIYDRGVLRVAIYSEDRVPFFYVNEAGQLVGSDVELATDMAAQFGVGVEFIRTASSFDQVVDQVASGQADIAVSKLSATLTRAKKTLFSQSYLTLRQGLLVNRLQVARLGQADTPLLETLKNVPIQIGVVAGTSYVRFANELFPAAELKPFRTTQEMLDAVVKGDITAIFYDELQLKDMIESNPTHSIELQLMIMDDQIDPIAVAVPPDHVQLLNWINLYLQTNHSKIAKVLVKYGVSEA